MARIEMVSDAKAGFMARIAFWFTKRKVGQVTGPMRILAHHRRLMQHVGWMEWGQAGAKAVPATLKSLCSIKVATLVGCPF